MSIRSALLFFCLVLGATHAQAQRKLQKSIVLPTGFFPKCFIETTSTDQVILAGSTVDSTEPPRPAILVYNLTTSKKQIFHPASDTLKGAILQTLIHNGELYVTGEAIIAGSNTDVWTAKLNPTTYKPLWQTLVGGKKADRGYLLAMNPQNNLFVAGTTESRGLGREDFYLFKLNDKGKLLWQTNDGYANIDIPYGMAIADDQTIGIAGFVHEPNGYGVKDIYIARFDTLGKKRYDKLKGTAKDDVAFALFYESSSNSYRLFANTEGKLTQPAIWGLTISHDVKRWNAEQERAYPIGRLGMYNPIKGHLAQKSGDGYLLVATGYSYARKLDILCVWLDAEGKTGTYLSFGNANTNTPIATQQTTSGETRIIGYDEEDHNYTLYLVK